MRRLMMAAVATTAALATTGCGVTARVWPTPSLAIHSTVHHKPKPKPRPLTWCERTWAHDLQFAGGTVWIANAKLELDNIRFNRHCRDH